MRTIRFAPGARTLLSGAWKRHGRMLRGLAVLYLAVAAIGKLRYALPHLLREVETWSGLDVRYRLEEVRTWFSGNPVYGAVDSAVYPPATHVILWPIVGWGSVGTARVLWAVTILMAAAALAQLIYRLASPAPARDRLLVAGLVVAAYPLPLSVMVGQLGIHVAALVAWGAFVLFRSRPRWSTDAVAAVLLAASLVKPSISLPLVVVALVVSRRVRPAALVAATYAALTAVAVAVQPSGALTLFRQWLQRAGERVPFEFGVPNLHMLLWWWGLEPWMTPISLLALAVTVIWAWRRRDAPPWILMGIAAIVTRLWAHSTPFDDAFLLFPAVALFRAAFGPDVPERRLAAGLFAAAWAALLTPNWALINLPPLATFVVQGGLAILWVLVLGFLVVLAERRADPGRGDRRDRSSSHPVTSRGEAVAGGF